MALSLKPPTLKQIQKQNKEFYLFSKEHEDHYKSAFLMFKENIILGIGPKLFRKNCNIIKICFKYK